MTEPNAASPPHRLLQLIEPRALGELALTLTAWRRLRRAPRGDGHAVLVLPGLAAGDGSTALLRRYLAGQGYRPHGWGLGWNRGPRPGVEAAVAARLLGLHAASGGRVSLIGWSLGGRFARLLALDHPEAVRCVITLGAPLRGDPRATRAWRLYELLSGRSVDEPGAMERTSAPLAVPATSICSRGDGMVAWRSCHLEAQGPCAENIELRGSHLGLGVNRAVLLAIADRLAQPEGGWRPYAGEGGGRPA